MGIFGSIAKGIGGLLGGSEKHTRTSSIDPRSQQFQQQIMGAAGDIYNQPFQRYGGQMVAGADPMFMQGVNRMMGPGAMGQYGQMANLGMGGAAAGMQGMQNVMGQQGLQGIGGHMSPYEQQVIGDIRSDIGRAQQQAMQNVGASATAAGAFGGSRHGLAEGKAAAEIARTGQQDINRMRQQGFQSAADRLMQQRQQQMMAGQGMGALGANLGFGGLGGMEDIRRLQGQTAMGAGDYMRNINQQQLGAQYGEFMREQQDPYKRYQAMLSGGQTALPYAQRTETMEMQRPMGSQLLGAAAGIGGMLTGGGPLASLAGKLFGGGGMPGYNMSNVPMQQPQTPSSFNFPMPNMQSQWIPQNMPYQQMPTAPWM